MGICIMRKITIISLLMSLIACSKSSSNNSLAEVSEGIACNSESVVRQIVANNLHLGAKQLYISSSLQDITTTDNGPSNLKCQANLSLASFCNNQTIKIPISYQVQQNKIINHKNVASSTNSYSLVQPLVTNVLLKQQQLTQLTQFLQHLQESSNLIADYQVTRKGNTYVVKKSRLVQELYVNGKVTEPLVSNYNVNIMNKLFETENEVGFLIGSFTGGTIDNDTLNNRLLVLIKDDGYYLSPEFSYVSSIESANGSIFITSGNSLNYASHDDYPIYEYKDKQWLVARAGKSVAEYQKDFSKLTAKQILAIAKDDQCYDSDIDSLDTSHACNYANKYCFMFKSLAKNVLHDSAYNILQQSCN